MNPYAAASLPRAGAESPVPSMQNLNPHASPAGSSVSTFGAQAIHDRLNSFLGQSGNPAGMVLQVPGMAPGGMMSPGAGLNPQGQGIHNGNLGGPHPQVAAYYGGPPQAAIGSAHGGNQMLHQGMHQAGGVPSQGAVNPNMFQQGSCNVSSILDVMLQNSGEYSGFVRSCGAPQDSMRVRIEVAARRGQHIANTIALKLEHAIQQGQPFADHFRRQIALKQLELDALNGAMEIFDRASQFQERITNMIDFDFDAVEPHQLTVEMVDLVFSKFIKARSDSPQSIRLKFHFYNISNVFLLKKSDVALAVLKMLARDEYHLNERFAPNMDYLIANGIVEESFPRTKIVCGGNYNIQTQLWLICFYLEVPGYKDVRGFHRATRVNEACFSSGPSIPEPSNRGVPGPVPSHLLLNNPNLVAIPEGEELPVQEEAPVDNLQALLGGGGLGTNVLGGGLAMASQPESALGVAGSGGGVAMASHPQGSTLVDGGSLSGSDSNSRRSARSKRGNNEMDNPRPKRRKRSENPQP